MRGRVGEVGRGQIKKKKKKKKGIPWWSSGWDSTLSLPRAGFPLVGELRSRKPLGVAKNKQTKKPLCFHLSI